MKFIFATLVVCFFAGSLAFHTVKPTPSTLIDISFLKTNSKTKKPSFAQLTTLMSQLSDSSQVVEFLTAHLAAINEQRQAKLAVLEQDRARCQEEGEFRVEAVAEGEASQALAQQQLDYCTGQAQYAQLLNEQATEAIQQWQDYLVSIQAQREADQRQNAQETEKLNEFESRVAGLNALLDAYEVSGLSPVGDASFIQTVNKLLKSSVKTGHSHLVNSVYQKLLMMHAKQTVNEEALSQIRTILGQMVDLSTQQRQVIADREAQNEAAYEVDTARVNALLSKLAVQVAFTSNFLATTEQCIAQEQQIVALSADKVQRNTDLLQSAQALCAAVEEEWTTSERSRNKEVNIVNALLSAVHQFEDEYQTIRVIDAINSLEML